MRWPLAALVAVLLALPAPAFARDDAVTSFDGTQIVLHFHPAEGLKPGERAPSVLVGPGWSSPGEANPDAASVPAVGATGVGPLRRAGFNVLTWDPRGFGESGGTVQVDDPAFEGRDAQALLDWLARQPEAQLDGPGDPRVGMSGVSYGGAIQLVLAAIDDRVEAIVPGIAWRSLITSLYEDATVKSGWGLVLTGAGNARGRLDPHIQNAFGESVVDERWSDETVAWFSGKGAANLIQQVRIPTMIVQGIADNLFPLDEAVRNHEVLARNGVPTRMLWFCGGHGTCVTDPGDVSRIERETIAWLRRHVMKDRSVDTGAPFAWVDQHGRFHESGAFPLRAGAPLAGEGSGPLPLTATGGSGGVTPRDGDPIGGLGAPFAASRAANAVNVAIPGPDRERQVVGAPRLELTYSGLSSKVDNRIFAQVVDDATGHVLGNQVTPIPVTLDGERHTVARDLEMVAAVAKPGLGYTLQLTPTSTLYNVAQRNGGLVQVESAKVTLPTGEPVAVRSETSGPATARRCTSRRSVVVHVKRRYRKRLRSVRVVMGKRVVARSRRAGRGVRVRLAGRPGGTVRVRLVMRLRGGRTVTDVRRYRLCARKNAG